MPETKSNNSTKLKLGLDLGIFLAFLVAMDPRWTGIAVHEWLATAALAAIVAHLLLSWDWIVQVTRRIAGTMKRQTRINYILNWALFFDVAILMLTGFMISEAVLPLFGLSPAENFAWRGLHDATANLFMILLGVHTALHWTWIVNAFKRYLFHPLGRMFEASPRKDVAA